MFFPGPKLSIKDMLLPILSGTLQTMGFMSWTKSCKLEPSVVKINIIMNLQIIFTFAIDLLFISREFNWYRTIGAACVFIAGIVIILGKVKRKGGTQKTKETVPKMVPIPLDSEKRELKASLKEIDLASAKKNVQGEPKKCSLENLP